MFEDAVAVKLTCLDHPEFDPTIEAAPKSCKCCAAIEFVKGWLWMARKKAEQINEGFYKRKAGQPEEAETPTPALDEIAHVAPAPAAPPAQDAMISSRLVKRKGASIGGGGRLKVKSAPEKPKFVQDSLL